MQGIGAQAFSCADEAVELLQKLTGENFGYRIEGTANERADAIQKAQQWWKSEGQKKFTFDAIEKLMKERDDQKR